MLADKKEQLRKILLSLDEPGLVALANKGLVRRAQKDLEGAALQIQESEEFLIVRGPDWTVWMPPEGPAKARDDTKATGITRQILSAAMFLRDSWARKSVQPDASTDIAAQDSSVNESAARLPDTDAESAVAASRAEAVVKESHATDKEKTAPRHKKKRAAVDSVLLEGEALHDALLHITSEDLSKWAGKVLVKEIIALLKLKPPLMDVDFPFGMVARFPADDIEVRLQPACERGARLLDAFISTAPRILHKRWVVITMLLLHERNGNGIKELPARSQAVDLCASRAVIDDCHSVLESMIASGIARISAATVERLFGMSLATATAQLPRVTHLLRSLSSEVSYLLQREARADTQRLLNTMSRAWALTSALKTCSPEEALHLAGQSRSEYHYCGDLELAGIGAYPWRTGSGHEGLTALFWEEKRARLYTWSVSRPLQSTGDFDAEAFYRNETPWTVEHGVFKICRSRFVLSSAKANYLGRLSSGQQTAVCGAVMQTDPLSLDFASRRYQLWVDLADFAVEQFPTGLRLANPLDRIVVLRPERFGDRFFDEMQQCFCWPVFDADQQMLLLSLPWNKLNEGAIAFLEALKPQKEGVTEVLARLVFSASGFTVEPLTFFGKGSSGGAQILNVAFDHEMIASRPSALLEQLRRKYGRDRIETRMTADDEWEEMHMPAGVETLLPHGLRVLLTETENFLLSLAETGFPPLHEQRREKLRLLQDLAVRCGLLELGQCLRHLQTHNSAGSLLRANYVCQLYWQAPARP